MVVGVETSSRARSSSSAPFQFHMHMGNDVIIGIYGITPNVLTNSEAVYSDVEADRKDERLGEPVATENPHSVPNQ